MMSTLVINVAYIGTYRAVPTIGHADDAAPGRHYSAKR